MSEKKEWYQLTTEEVFEALASSGGGITSDEAKDRLRKYGHNELKIKKQSPIVRFLLQFHNPLLYILIFAGIVCFALEKFMDMGVIMSVVLGTVIIGFIQEGKANASLEALRKMMVPECAVLRDDKRKVVPARELVPGDVVMLESGDRVPADLRLFMAKSMSADESMLTGESMPVNKNADPIPRPGLAPSERRCIAFSGVFITRGRGMGVVIATGKDTEIGKLAGLMKETGKVVPPIMRKISGFTRSIMIAIPALGAVNFVIGLLRGYDVVYMFLATVGLIVAGIPEGLPAAVMATFAFGTINMARQNALIRRLPAAETLGCTTVICSDKTGTLTRNEMTVTKIYCGDKDYLVTGTGYAPKGDLMTGGEKADLSSANDELAETLRAGYLCNDAVLDETAPGVYGIKGDPTEGALVVSAHKAGLTEKLPRIDEIPFEPEQQYMATLHRRGEGTVLYVKGSPEKILLMCRARLAGGSVVSLEKERVLEKAGEMAKDALRVLGLAYKITGREVSNAAGELNGLVFLGLQGMIDPPREEAITAVKKCKAAGIRAVMITGDHPQTASAVARQIGIGAGETRAVIGEEIEKMNDRELFDIVDTVSVYSRVAPEHKFRIVEQLQKKGHIVAVTGDGVNDAPALKRADIGIAMGITGTEVSKEAADMVLTDDNFASIVSAVEEGRHVFNNIWKVILYLLPTNGGQVAAMIGAVLLSPFIPVFRERLPLEPVQILWVNLIIALACAIPLAREAKEKGILDRPPRDINEPLANKFFIVRVGLISIVEAAAVFSVFISAYLAMRGAGHADHLAKAGTAAFTTLIFVEVFYLFTARSVRGSAFAINFFSNKWVIIGAAVTLALQVVIVYSLPLFGMSPFRTVPFPAEWWLIIIAIAPSGFLAVETEKLIRRRLKKAEESIKLVGHVVDKELEPSELRGELREIIAEGEGIAEDRFDRLIKGCEILDIDDFLSIEEMFRMVSSIFSGRSGVDEKTIYELFMEREKLGSTAIAPGLAIPHVISGDFKEFDIVLARSRKGVAFPMASQPVHTMFVVAGPSDERNFYLRALAAITQIAQDDNFERNWLKARNVEELREIVLSAERKRTGIV
jgi:P-type Ca2+ transporter type 2C